MEDDGLTTGEAAKRLHTTKPTVVSLIRRGDLTARRERHGSRYWWIVEPASIARFLEENKPFDGRRRRSPGDGEAAAKASPPVLAAEDERDELRARVVALQDALARQRSVTELWRQADLERATVIEHLVAAVQAAERADDLRRRALAELEEAVAGFTRPGNVGGIA